MGVRCTRRERTHRKSESPVTQSSCLNSYMREYRYFLVDTRPNGLPVQPCGRNAVHVNGSKTRCRLRQRPWRTQRCLPYRPGLVHHNTPSTFIFHFCCLAPSDGAGTFSIEPSANLWHSSRTPFCSALEIFSWLPGSSSRYNTTRVRTYLTRTLWSSDVRSDNHLTHRHSPTR